MENTKDLLMLVLEQHYKRNPKTLQDALSVIQMYVNSKHTQEHYEKTLNVLHDSLKDLPQNILLYLLTTVPIPKESVDHSKSTTLLDLMKETHTSLPNNIRPILLEYLNSKIPNSPKTCISQKSKVACTADPVPPANVSPVSQEKVKKLKRKSSPVKNEKRSKVKSDVYCKRLDDLCAEYVYRNINYLNSVYKGKLSKIMHLKLCCRQKQQNVLRDTNRKIKLLRMIENGDVTNNFLKEEFDKKDFSIAKSGISLNLLDEGSVLSSELKTAIDVLYDKL